MALREDVIYHYDGTLDGMLTCIFEAFAKKESPSAILSPLESQASLFETRVIPADFEKAGRVIRGIERTAGFEAADLVRLTHLTCLPDKELRALSFTRLAMKTGRGVCNMLTDQRVNVIDKAVRNLQIEAHHLCGFVRFTETDGTLVSLIEPHNDVLPLLDPHFSDRFCEERFIIYDQNHRSALIHLPGMSRIVPLDALNMPALSQKEADIQQLWRKFHETIAIEGRINRKLQQNLMPLRFRPNMTEFRKENVSVQSFAQQKGVLAE